MSDSSSRALRECIWIVVTTLMLMSLSSRSRVHATVICNECRPLSLQEAPAVGLSLAPGYGSISVQFANGTILDVAAEHGTEAYLQAMKHWQHLKPNPVVVKDRQKAETGAPMLSLERLRSWLKIGSQTPKPAHSGPFYQELVPILEMMRTLYDKASTLVPLRHKMVYLGIPDFEPTTSFDDTRLLRPLVDEAGLGYLRYKRQSQLSILQFYNLDDCFGLWLDEYTEVPDEECEKYQDRPIQSVFFIHLDESSLNLRFLIREDGFFPEDLGSPRLLWVADSFKNDNKTHWDWVEHSLRDFLGDHNIVFDLISLSGTQVTDPSFQSIIRDLFQDNEKIAIRDYLRGVIDHMFASARAAARIARFGMCDGYEGCMPNSWCPVSGYCKRWAWHNEDEEVNKTEL